MMAGQEAQAQEEDAEQIDDIDKKNDARAGSFATKAQRAEKANLIGAESVLINAGKLSVSLYSSMTRTTSPKMMA